ncbi:MAG: efflux RND transporter periplasmic adaptor subunit [Verrucomicrobiota bacterium]
MNPEKILSLRPLLVGVFLPGAIAVVSCQKQEEAAVPRKPRPVITYEVPAASDVVRRSFSGLVDSASGAGIAFEVSGRVIEVIAKEGESYAAGDVLARLDTTEYENQLNAARAQQTEAQQNLRRTQQLFETGNAPRSQLEAAISAEQSASSNFKTAQKRITDSTLRMPYPGVIGSVMIDAQTMASLGQPVMTIQGESGMEFVIGVPARAIDTLEVGQTCEVSIGSIPDEVFEARIDSISPQASENTTYPVTLTLNSEDPRIREGLDGEASIFIPAPEGKSVAIPASAVVTDPEGKKYVWTITRTGDDQGEVAQRFVKLGGLRPDGKIAILDQLNEGELIVSRGANSLMPGEAVTLTGESASAAEESASE